MRVFVVILFAASILLPPSAALSAGEDMPSPLAGSGKSRSDSPSPLAGKSLDQLFVTLADRGDEAAGQAAEAEIQRRWLESGSDTVDLLMQWSAESLAAKDFGGALDFLDAVTVLKPDYAEGWNRRATIFYLQDDYGKAIADLEKVLALQPRHFGALAGLGLILRDIDRKAEALAVLEKALAIDPYIDPDVKDTIDELKPKVEGQEI
ncbi:hypothetical protein C3941_16685 [Kaistia algarum]|uniref:tetratricopeptide repeat protein n=1 Tax=Kaistia algarum TaxID=2083279 RepID=UPI000CE78257|nr:tetratricopeptide repeat protein [Kaistia algarum]MCX5516400.1 tetratricopeptide repeat protein [Kaistia algarum]PPE78688.1 hypothetical protein C3941_16685 [Kaistia algarum]